MDRIDIELDVLLSKAKTNIAHSLDITLHTSSLDLVVTKSLEYAVHSDYRGNVADLIDVSFYYPLGDFIFDILPERDNLEITIKHMFDGKVDINRYKFIPTNLDDFINHRLTTLDRTSLNNMDVFTVEGQCLDRMVEVLLRSTVAGGIFKESTPLEVVTTSMGQVLDNISIADNERVDSIRTDMSQNAQVYEHILLPPTKKFFKLPTIMQENEYGIYNGGIGTYIQKKMGERNLSIYQLHVYLENSERTHLRLINVNTNELSLSDRTSSFENNILRVITDSSDNVIDPGAMSSTENGLGFTGVDSGKVLADTVTLAEGEVTIKEDSYRVNETTTRPDGIDNRIDAGLIHNGYAARSAINVHAGSYIQVNWENSDRFNLEPGMLVTYIKRKDGKVVEVKGILHGAFTVYDLLNRTSRSVLHIFLLY